MASRKIEDLHPILQEATKKAILLFKERHPSLAQPMLSCTHRPNKEQDELFEQGRTLPGKKVTNAKGGQSPHNFMPALAKDIAFMNQNKQLDWNLNLFKLYADIIMEVEPLVVWGGNFRSLPDSPHFELKDWKKYVS